MGEAGIDTIKSGEPGKQNRRVRVGTYDLQELSGRAALSIMGALCVATNRNRPDKDGTHRLAFERNKKKIYATQTVCGICGEPVDFGLKYPHPLSPCIDHIVPVAKGGHPSDLDNLQLAHWTCNRQKSDKLIQRQAAQAGDGGMFSNQVLPQSCDWTAYRSR